MGKRTFHETGKRHDRRPRDLWSTIDARAVPPLIPHLPPSVTYNEPMAGDGSLMRLLHDADPSFICTRASDLEPGCQGIERRDVFETEIGDDADVFISNPPWTRGLLHRVIVHLSDQAPTFLLFDSDWAHTGQAGAFMERCRKIIHVGRLIWVPGTTTTGFTSCSWYEFGRPVAGSAPTFYGHGQRPPEARRRARRVCPDCGFVIDRFARWRLQTRNGVPCPVHVDCENPSGTRVQEPGPLLALMQDVGARIDSG